MAWVPVMAHRLISIHAPREGSDRRVTRQVLNLTISIHAPREGSDRRDRDTARAKIAISIHAPREGSDSWVATISASIMHFYPRSP